MTIELLFLLDLSQGQKKARHPQLVLWFLGLQYPQNKGIIYPEQKKPLLSGSFKYFPMRWNCKLFLWGSVWTPLWHSIIYCLGNGILTIAYNNPGIELGGIFNPRCKNDQTGLCMITAQLDTLQFCIKNRFERLPPKCKWHRYGHLYCATYNETGWTSIQ